MRTAITQGIVAKLLIKYNIDYQNDPDFTSTERSIFEQIDRELQFYDEELAVKRRAQLANAEPGQPREAATWSQDRQGKRK